MSKFTRRFKKNKKNKSLKRGGAEKSEPENYEPENYEPEKSEREGVIDIVQNKVADVASSAATTLTDIGLKIAGLERVNKTDEDNDATKKVDENINKVSDAASGIISDVGNVVDKTGAAIIENVNEVLGSSVVKETTEQAAEKTADIVKEGAEKFNEALNDPEVKAEVKESIEKASEIGAIVVEAAEKPIEKAVDVAANAAQKATGAALAGVVKVGTDVMAAVPGVGAFIELGKMMNDASKAASAVVEAGTEAVEAGSDAFIETKKNVEKGLKDLEEKKQMSDKISNRTIKSITEFENPITSAQSAGSTKTRRKLTKRKANSKRVRFSI
jgi:hypothetical protein